MFRSGVDTGGVLMKRCFLDLDGVLVDFYASALPIHGCPDLYLDPKNLGKYRAQEILGLSNPDFWEPLDANPDFWSTIPKTPEADAIVAIAEETFGMENCGILTAPNRNPRCFTGKIAWVEKYYPQLASRIIFAHCKGFCAGPGSVLLDDSDEMINEFRASGGSAITVPRPWNAYHTGYEVLPYIRLQLDWLREKQNV